MKREFDFDLVKRLCAHYLWKQFHDRHLEDCIQYTCMRWLEQKDGFCNVQWVVIDYCRRNGIGVKGKLSAKTLETATMVGLQGDENESTKENGFLFDEYAANQPAIEDLDILGHLEEFISPLGLTQETTRWVLKNYQFKEKIR